MHRNGSGAASHRATSGAVASRGRMGDSEPASVSRFHRQMGGCLPKVYRPPSSEPLHTKSSSYASMKPNGP